jgi:hypothetical protein
MTTLFETGNLPQSDLTSHPLGDLAKRLVCSECRTVRQPGSPEDVKVHAPWPRSAPELRELPEGYRWVPFRSVHHQATHQTLTTDAYRALVGSGSHDPATEVHKDPVGAGLVLDAHGVWSVSE